MKNVSSVRLALRRAKFVLCMAWLLLVCIAIIPVAFIAAAFTPQEKWDELGLRIKAFIRGIT